MLAHVLTLRESTFEGENNLEKNGQKALIFCLKVLDERMLRLTEIILNVKNEVLHVRLELFHLIVRDLSFVLILKQVILSYKNLVFQIMQHLDVVILVDVERFA